MLKFKNSLEQSVAAEFAGPLRILQVRTVSEDGRIDRRSLAPAENIDGVWRATDLSAESSEIAELCADEWSEDVVNAYIKFMQADLLPSEGSPRRVGSPREFLHLFTDAEKSLFFATAAKHVDLQIWWADASTGDFSLDHPSVEVGLAQLVGLGILTVERKDEIAGTDFDAV